MSMLVVRGDALHLPLRDNTVDLIVTSPPYFALRDYGTGHAKELGSEATPAQFLHALWAATLEMKRVLRPTGSIFINLGDKYATDNRGSSVDVKRGNAKFAPAGPRGITLGHGVQDKSLLLLPEAYRLGCTGMLAQLGGPDPGLNLIARAVIVWDKPNGLPESVRDRVRRSHEDWVHLTKSPRYYAALDEIRTPHAPQSLARATRAYNAGDQFSVGTPNTLDPAQFCNPLGALPGSVWTIPSEPLRLPPWIDTQHYAAFPTRWPEQLIKAFTPPGICVRCKVGRFPIVHRDEPERKEWAQGQQRRSSAVGGGQVSYLGTPATDRPATIVGYGCGCTPHTDHPATGGSWTQGRGNSDGKRNHPERDENGNRPSGPRPSTREYHLDGWVPPPTTPAIVADVFGGTGTTAMVAHALGRVGVSIDLSMAYSRLATDPTLARQRAGKVHGRVYLERQGSLL